jgi:uncharacterized membrane protein YcaP (DUF421 family)
LLVIFFRTAIIYMILIIAMRITGKRQIAELQVSEFVTAIMLSELAVQPISNINIPLFYAILPILTLISLEVIITFLVTKSKTLKRLFDGEPSFLIKRGILDQSELIKQRISVDEFIGELRQKDISAIDDVDYAILEQNGKLSVFPKTGSGVSFPLIIDGDINRRILNLIGQSEVWLMERLTTHKAELGSVLLFTIDDAGNEHLIRKNRQKAR